MKYDSTSSNTDNALIGQLNAFRYNYYKNLDDIYWSSKLFILSNKLKKLKDQKKKDRILLDLYITYLQSMEILFINIHALSLPVNNFPAALFITSQNLREFIKEYFLNNTKMSDWFLNKVIYRVHKKADNFSETTQLYQSLLKECANDYITNFDLLNAYKHGYRLNAKHEKGSISIRTKSNEAFILNESDSNITYYTKDVDKKSNDIVILEKSLGFKLDRISGKTLFITALLNNIKYSMMHHHNSKTKLNLVMKLSINDKEGWMKSFGEYTVAQPIFSLGRKKQNSLGDLKSIIRNSVNKFLKTELYLFNVDVNERSLTHKLAEYLQLEDEIANGGWKVDCEYNRYGENKKIIELMETFIEQPVRVDDKKAKTVYPDIIIHKRGKDGKNWAIIEAKKDSTEEEKNSDMEKLKILKDRYNYAEAIFLNFITRKKKIHCYRLNNQGKLETLFSDSA